MSNYKTYLRRQPTLDEITGYLHFGQERITYPDRSATILRDSPYLGLYDGITFHELEEQEQQVEKEKLKEMKIREIAGDSNTTRALVELASTGSQTANPTTSTSSTTQTGNQTSTAEAQTDPMLFDMTIDDDKNDYLNYLDFERGKKKKILKDRRAKIIKIVRRHLGTEVNKVPYIPSSADDDNVSVDYGDQDDRDIVNYGSDIDIDDVLFENRVDKRKRETEETKEKKPKIKDEKKPIIKEEGKTVKKGIKKDKTLTKQKEDDDIQISGLNINRNTDMDFWNEASAREMRSQLNLRYPGKVGDWAFKTRLQLLNIIKDKIKKGDW